MTAIDHDHPKNVLLYGALLFLLVSVVRIQELFSFLTYLHAGKITAVLVVVLFAVFPKPQVRVPLLQIPQVKIVLAIYALCLFSVPFSVYQGQSFNHAVLGFPKTLLLFFLLIYTVNNFTDLRMVLWTYIFGVFLLAFFTITSTGSHRLTASATYDPNDIAL
ncbi:hypothetical protein KKA14_16680, partial [bacterium]|nr:hypothetical protein [bacterium]